jgi:hypothetical protein
MSVWLGVPIEDQGPVHGNRQAVPKLEPGSDNVIGVAFTQPDDEVFMCGDAPDKLVPPPPGLPES